MSGVRLDGHAYFKGAVDAVLASSVPTAGARRPGATQVERISRRGRHPAGGDG